MRETIRNWNGDIVGYIEDKFDGGSEARSYTGTILGSYDPNMNVTRNFYGTIVSHGNSLSSLVWDDYRSKK